MARDPDIFRVRHFRIWITKASEITRSRNNIQIVEDPVIAVLLFHLRDAAIGILDVAENNRLGWAGLRARGGKRIPWNPLLRRSACARERDDLCFFDALYAVGAFL